MNSKTEIRKIIKKRREALDPVEKMKLDKKIFKQIKTNNAFNKARTILLYMPHKNEVDLIEFLKENIHKKNLVFPRVNKTKLTLHSVTSFDDFEVGSFAIIEPKSTIQQINPENIDLAVIPGIVFDKNGNRIGYGKGFYDQLAKQLKCKKIGLAYDFQIVDKIPFESHDIPVDLIVTETKTIKCIN